MENPLPGAALPSTCVSVPASPRRGLPHPLRSVFAVSRDPDGLFLSTPCGLFQPLTPMGFPFPAPSSGASTSALRPTLPYRGDGFHPGGSWSTRSRVAAEAVPLLQTAAPFARRLLVRLQLSCSFVAACIRRPPASHPEMLRRPSLAASSSGLPRRPSRRPTEVFWLDPLASTPLRGCLSRALPTRDCVLPQPWASPVGHGPFQTRCAPDPPRSHAATRSRLLATTVRASRSALRPRGGGHVPFAATGLPATRTRFKL